MTRARCPVCASLQPLTAAGVLRAHWERGQSHRCMGSGWAPERPAPVRP